MNAGDVGTELLVGGSERLVSFGVLVLLLTLASSDERSASRKRLAMSSDLQRTVVDSAFTINLDLDAVNAAQLLLQFVDPQQG